MKRDRPRFLCDMMLGRLAKWLRLLGYDTKYFPLIDDSELIKIALEEQRILLTRDTLLLKRRPIKQGRIGVLFIESDRYVGQLRQVVNEFDLEDGKALCNVCNTKLITAAKESVKKEIPPYVFKTQTEFKGCPVCGRIFWRATHWERITAVKRDIRVSSIKGNRGNGELGKRRE